MLEKPADRVKLLKAGWTGKEIEKIYIVVNKFELMAGYNDC